MKAKWNSGPPPSIGWWPASVCKNDSCYRWWDGKHWSRPALDYWSAESAAKTATTTRAVDQHAIKWTARPKFWPARSRT